MLLLSLQSGNAIPPRLLYGRGEQMQSYSGLSARACAFHFYAGDGEQWEKTGDRSAGVLSRRGFRSIRKPWPRIKPPGPLLSWFTATRAGHGAALLLHTHALPRDLSRLSKRWRGTFFSFLFSFSFFEIASASALCRRSRTCTSFRREFPKTRLV